MDHIFENVCIEVPLKYKEESDIAHLKTCEDTASESSSVIPQNQEEPKMPEKSPKKSLYLQSLEITFVLMLMILMGLCTYSLLEPCKRPDIRYCYHDRDISSESKQTSENIHICIVMIPPYYQSVNLNMWSIISSLMVPLLQTLTGKGSTIKHRTND